MKLPEWWGSDKPYKIMDALDDLPNIPSDVVDVVLADPPYGISFQSAWLTESDRFDKIAGDDAIDPRWLKDAHRILKSDGALYCFTRWDVYPVWAQHITESGFIIKSVIVWNRMSHGMGDLTGSYAPQYDLIIFAIKEKHTLNGPRPKDIISVLRVAPEELTHPCEKPVDLLIQLIKNSTKINGIVLDPFLGSGTTIRACRMAGRLGLGYEINPAYEHIINERIMEKIPMIESFGEQMSV